MLVDFRPAIHSTVHQVEPCNHQFPLALSVNVSLKLVRETEGLDVVPHLQCLERDQLLLVIGCKVFGGRDGLLYDTKIHTEEMEHSVLPPVESHNQIRAMLQYNVPVVYK